MSELNDDKEVIAKGRKNVLKDTNALQVSAGLRDQIPAKLLAKVRDLKVGEKVSKLWYLGNANRANWLSRQQEYLADWDEFLVASDDGAFDGSSNLHIPMPLIVAKTLHARFLQALLGIDPPFIVRPRTDGAVEASAMLQEVLEYAVKTWANYNEGAYEVLDEWIWHWVTTGCGLLKLRWDVEFTRFVDVENVTEPAAPKSVIDDQGQEQLIPQTKTSEKEVAKTIKKFEGPVFEAVLNEDLLMVGGKGNPQKSDSVLHRTYMTASELWTLVDRKIFDGECVKEIIEKGKNSLDGTDVGSIKYQRAFNAGMSSVNSETQLDRYEIIEAYLKIDVDGSGINSDIVCWVHLQSREILKATYLHRMHKSGEIPIYKIDFHKRAGQEYGIGIVEMLHPISVELDAMHNMRIDFGLISTMPIGFYKATSSLDPATINYSPGSLIPLDNPQTDIYFPNMGNRTSFGMQEEAGLQNLVERLTGISDLNLGVISGQGATRTATGTRALLGESNANLDVYLRRMNLGWTKVLDGLKHMIQQRIPNDFGFRLTGDDGANYFARVKQKEDITGDFDLEVSANSASSNKQIMEQNADQIVQMTGNPLDIQLGVITPRARYEALKNKMSIMGQKDYSRFIQEPQQPRIFTPKEEVDRILRGAETPITPQSDHEGFLAYFEHIMSEPELLGSFAPEDVQALAAQAQKHQQMMKAMEEQAAQARNMQQQAQNAQQPQLQTAPGGNPMQGPGPDGGNAPQGAPQ